MVGFRNKGFKLLPLLLAGCILMTSQGVMAARTAAMGSKPVITIALVDTFSPDFYLHTYVPTVMTIFGLISRSTNSESRK